MSRIFQMKERDAETPQSMVKDIIQDEEVTDMI